MDVGRAFLKRSFMSEEYKRNVSKAERDKLLSGEHNGCSIVRAEFKFTASIVKWFTVKLCVFNVKAHTI